MFALLAAGSVMMATPAGPAGQWSVRVNPASCVLERQTPGPVSTLSIATTPGSDSYRIAIAGKDVGKTASFVPATVGFDPSSHRISGFGSVASLPQLSGQLIWMAGVTPALLDELQAATSVTLATAGARASMPIPKAAAAIGALRLCNADQLIEWGADAAQFAPGGALPVALQDRDGWVSKKDLLAISSRVRPADIHATFRVGISPTGTIDRCERVDAATDQGAEQIACAAVLTKVLFSPAKNGGGQPVRGVATFDVVVLRRP